MSFDPPRSRRCERSHRSLRAHGGGAALSRSRMGIAACGKQACLGQLHACLAYRPQFVAYAVRDLPAAIPLLARKAFGLPLLTWTVRSADDRRRAARYADQMIFEGFRP